MACLFRILAAAAALATCCAAPVRAQTLTPQQQRMNDCNVIASSKGYQENARKAYLTACMNGRSPSAAAMNKPLTVKQQKTSACEAQANSQRLGGIARRTFMKSCLRM